MKRLISTLGVGVALAVTGCGGSSHKVPPQFSKGVGFARPTAQQVARQCPRPKAGGVGGGQMGCAIPKPPKGVKPPLKLQRLPSGNIFPDVSSWQGNVNWDAVKNWQLSHHYKPGGVFKMGEYSLDPYASRNNSMLRARGMVRIGYWFVRNTGCSHEANQIINEAHALGLTQVVEDDEVPEANGYDRCLTPPLRRAGLRVDEYASPGAYPGGNGGPGNGAWVAAYGPSHGPCLPWSCHLVAWQFTDGQWGPVVDIPGIGRDDVNVDYGMLEEGHPAPPAPPPDPLSFLPKSVITFANNVKASEHGTASTWDKAKCKNPVRRSVCKSSSYHLRLLAGRDWFLAHNHRVHGKWVARRPDWNTYGRRFHALWTRYKSR